MTRLLCVRLFVENEHQLLEPASGLKVLEQSLRSFLGKARERDD